MNWEYEKHIEYKEKTYHLWSAIHREGFKIYSLTHQPKDQKVSFVKPIRGGGFWTSLQAVSITTGIPFELLKGARI